MAGCGADTEANLLMGTLTADQDFDIPIVDLNGPDFTFPSDPSGPMFAHIEPLTIEQLTTKQVDGTGAFDAVMTSLGAHLKGEFMQNRITGAEYTKAYIAMVDSALSNSVQFLLSKDQSYWAAQQAQLQAFTARVQLEVAKVQLAGEQLKALNMKATYALTKMQLANEEIAYCSSKFNLESMLPSQLAMLNSQKLGQDNTNAAAAYNLSVIMPKQSLLLTTQEISAREQAEAHRAQTTDLRVDGFPVQGVLGKQKALYEQQITSYKRDAEVKAARPFVDAWITQKTIDEGLVPPNGFTNASLDTILTALKTNNALG